MKPTLKTIKQLFIVLFSVFMLVACTTNTNNTTQTTNQTQTEQSFEISQLNNTKNFNNHALEHIFYGTINRNNEATGFHFEKTGENATVIENTRSKNDKNGIYTAKVTVEGIEKKGFSSFFPQNWSPQQVVDAINSAYVSKKHVSGNIYEGKVDGITIQMYLTDNQKIISAFPVYNR